MKLKITDIAVFGMISAVMYISKLAMSFLPNIHLLGVIIVAITVVYRYKALYPIYIYVLIEGLFAGFSSWWVPSLYVWTVLWGFVMLIPQTIPKKVTPIVYMCICSLHGFLFGTLYAPAQALLFGMNFESMIAWIIAGIPYDCIHGISNFICALLITPLIVAINYINSSLKK